MDLKCHCILCVRVVETKALPYCGIVPSSEDDERKTFIDNVVSQSLNFHRSEFVLWVYYHQGAYNAIVKRINARRSKFGVS